jgi:lipopolysaccharide transport system ATP-binding protein
MPSLAISADRLSKLYRLGVIGTGTLHDDFERWWARVRGLPDPTLKVDGSNSSTHGSVWALKDVSFDLQEGTTLGVIGSNGAGKSTLLKVLSRITAPTAGCVKLRGRIASLLEVGTGFHPELTGRENVFLNGTILGMRKTEVARKFDEIVAFSEVGPFIDTPVKRYSSGMHVRLAFAVAAHLDPDVLIVDEVLAVGDVAFQKRCVGKMQDLTSSQHRTVLFVSHNMASIKALCGRAILLDHGRIAADGDVDDAVAKYIERQQPAATGVIPENRPSIGTGEVRLKSVKILTATGDAVSELYLGQPFKVAFVVEALKDIKDAVFEVDISTLDGTYVTTSLSVDGSTTPVPLAAGVHTVCLELDVVLLADHYTIDLGVHHSGAPWTMDFVRRTLDFHVLNVSESGGDRYFFDVKRGFVRPRGRWHVSAGPERT